MPGHVLQPAALTTLTRSGGGGPFVPEARGCGTSTAKIKPDIRALGQFGFCERTGHFEAIWPSRNGGETDVHIIVEKWMGY